MANNRRIKQKIGLFGGSFDPIHNGHIKLAINLMEAHNLDKVLFIPVRRNPQKKSAPVASNIHRVKMLKLALKGVPHCAIETIELSRPEPSYMIDTVQALQKKYKKADFYLLMGRDLLVDFTKWKLPRELVVLAPPLIATRKDAALKGSWQKDPILKKAIMKGLTKTQACDVSATAIRDRIRKGLFCGHLIDRHVLKYIQKHNLYKAGR